MKMFNYLIIIWLAMLKLLLVLSTVFLNSFFFFIDFYSYYVFLKLHQFQITITRYHIFSTHSKVLD